MKHFLLFSLVWLLPVSIFAQTGPNVQWRSDPWTVTIPNPPATTGNWQLEVERSPVAGTSPLTVSGANTGQTVLNNYTVPGKLTSGSSTCTAAWLVLYRSGVYPAPKVKAAWKQMRPDGQPDPMLFGGFDPAGNRIGPQGHPVDENGVEQEPEPPPLPERYFASATYHNTGKFPVSLRITWVSLAGPTILLTSGHCEPGASYTSEGYADEPFRITIQPVADDIDWGDPVTADSEPVEEDDEEHPPQPPPGSPGGVGGPPANSGGQWNGGNAQVPKPAALPPQPRPGVGDPNDDARNEELKGELGRILDQLNSMGNQAAGDADRTNELLAGIKDAAEETADNTGGDGIGSGPGALVLPGTGAGDSNGEEHGGFGELGIPAMIDGIRISGAGMLQSASDLRQAIGLGQSYGSAPLAWSFTLPQFGTFSLNVGEALGEWAGIIRQIILFILSWNFVLGAFKIVTNAFN
jgi:hypothetical protein